MYIGKIETGRSYKKLLIIFAVISLLLVGFVTYASFSRATIKITPKEGSVSATLDAQIMTQADIDKNKSSGVFVAGRVLEKTVENNYPVNDVATATIEEKARGTITIYNKRDKDQPLLPSTQLLSENGILFRTDARVVAEAGKNVEVGITADQPGESGNLPPGKFKIVKLYQDWQDEIYGETKTATKGGTREAKVATEAEIERGKTEAQNAALSQAIADFRKDLPDNENLLADQASQDVLSVKPSVKTDTETDKFEVAIKLKVRALAFDKDALKKFTQTKLEASIPANKELIEVLADSFQFTASEIDFVKTQGVISATMEASVIPKLSAQIFDKKPLIGLNEWEIKQYFDNNADIKETSVSFSPFWVKSVPTLEDHVEIVINR
ncbi:MAG: hypothetical protein ACD_68C00046G0002 [uncultured bacterium]|nr:MAG: hypothetical protein ACD_68C00046G0002 [uncultured bacterium]